VNELTLIPSALSTAEFFGLIAASLMTSFTSASIGVGGGMMLLAVMAQVIPSKALIPVHGVVQLGSNLGRAAVMLEHISQPHVIGFLTGSAIGAIVGVNIVVTLPTGYLKLALGGFILHSVYGPKLTQRASSLSGLSLNGLFSSLLTMFVGATGPFVIASLRPFGFNPINLIATSAACMVIQHLFKVLAFGLLGFAFVQYAPLIGLMIVTGFLGTLLGQRTVLNINERQFQYLLNIVLTLLALRLLYSGFNLLSGRIL